MGARRSYCSGGIPTDKIVSARGQLVKAARTIDFSSITNDVCQLALISMKCRFKVLSWSHVAVPWGVRLCNSHGGKDR